MWKMVYSTGMEGAVEKVKSWGLQMPNWSSEKIALWGSEDFDSWSYRGFNQAGGVVWNTTIRMHPCYILLHSVNKEKYGVVFVGVGRVGVTLIQP